MGRPVTRHPVRRVPGQGGQRRVAPGEDRPVRSAAPPRTSRSCSATRARSSWCPATGSRSPRRSTPSHELAELLSARGIEVDYAIHPVAGSHAGPHERAARRGQRALRAAARDGRQSTPSCARTDVALVVGANDVVNPAARTITRVADLRDADPRRRPGASRWSFLKRSMRPRLRRHGQQAAVQALGRRCCSSDAEDTLNKLRLRGQVALDVLRLSDDEQHHLQTGGGACRARRRPVDCDPRARPPARRGGRRAADSHPTADSRLRHLRSAHPSTWWTPPSATSLLPWWEPGSARLKLHRHRMLPAEPRTATSAAMMRGRVMQ